jgi:hypothetical protein
MKTDDPVEQVIFSLMNENVFAHSLSVSLSLSLMAIGWQGVVRDQHLVDERLVDVLSFE